MKRIWANITSLDNPVKDGNFIEITEFTTFNETKISEKVNDGFIFPLLTFNGNLEFYGKMYRAVRDLIQSGEFFISIKVYEETDLALSGELSLRSTLSPTNQTSLNELVAETIYDGILREYDTEYNILNVVTTYKIFSLVANRYEFFSDIIVDTANATPSILNIPPPPAFKFSYLLDASNRPTFLGATPSGDAWDGNIDTGSEWSLYKTVFFPLSPIGIFVPTRMTRDFVREYRLEQYIGNEIQNVPPPPWVYLEDLTVDDSLFAKYIRGVQLTDLWSVSGSVIIPATPNLNVRVSPLVFTSQFSTQDGEIKDLYNRGRLMFDAIKYMVGKADSSILFDETGNLPVNAVGGDSFSYLKTFSETIIVGTEPQEVFSLANILLEQLTDAILEDDDFGGLVERSNKAAIGNLTMKRLFSFLSDFMQIGWYLEERGSDVYFMFRQESEQDKILGTTPQSNFKTFKGNNWSEDFLEYNHDDSDKFNRVKFEFPIGNNADFQNQTGKFPQLQDFVKNEITVKTNYFFTDIEDSQTRRDRYPETGNTQFMMFATIERTSDNLLTGFPTGNFPTFNYADGILTVDTDGVLPSGAFVSSNLITDEDLVSAKKTVNISFTIDSVTVNAGQFDFDILEEGVGVTTLESDITSIGDRSFAHILSSNFISSNGIRIRFVSPIGSDLDFTVSDIVITTPNFEIIRGIGKKTGSQYLNSPLSVANLGINHWTYKLPANQFDFNGSVTTYPNSRLVRDRKLITIFVPIYKNGEFNYNQLIDTDAGEAEIIEAEYPMINGFAKIKLVLPQI